METEKQTETSVDSTILNILDIAAEPQMTELDIEWADRCVGNYEEDSVSYETWSNSQSSTKADDMSPPPIMDNLVEETKRPGRKKEQDSQLLSNFKTRGGKPPKKEYLRCMLIRGHKKLNRQILSGNIPNKNSNSAQENQKRSEILTHLHKHFFKNKHVLEVEAQTQSGPTTDGKKKRVKVSKETQKSFNNTYIQQYFKHSATKESFYYYIELKFLGFDPEILCEFFNFKCCQSNIHFLACRENWIALKSYLQVKMFTDLKIDPWIPRREEEIPYSFPSYEDETFNELFSNSMDLQEIGIEGDYNI